MTSAALILEKATNGCVRIILYVVLRDRYKFVCFNKCFGMYLIGCRILRETLVVQYRQVQVKNLHFFSVRQNFRLFSSEIALVNRYLL